LVFVLMAVVGAWPAPASAAGGAPIAIVSSGTPVAVGLDLTVDTLQVHNNSSVAVATLDVRFELVRASAFDAWPFDFSQDQTDSACDIGNESPAYAVTCHYAVPIAAGAGAAIAVKLHLSPSTDSATAPAPQLKITVGTGADTDTVTVGPIVRVKRVSDLAVRVAGQLTGRVGGVVNVQWIVTNLGPDTAPSVGLVLVAPPGTEWTGSAAAACNPPAIPNTKFRCVSAQPLPAGAGHAWTQTWQLKIDSLEVGAGEITVTTDLFTSTPDPYLNALDPNSANNAANVTVDVEAGPAPAGISATRPTGPPRAGVPDPFATTATTSPADASPTPATVAATPPAASPVTLVSANSTGPVGGAAVLIATALLSLFARRLYRRRTVADSGTGQEGHDGPADG
jgi:hypothetical protein